MIWSSWRSRITELARFGSVGAIAFVVDIGIFNLFRLWILPSSPLTSKIIAGAIATLVSWLLNRSWTFAGRSNYRLLAELFAFVGINIVGLAPPLICLWFSHYLLGFTSPLADNIAGNFIGIALGTILRYFGYRYLVFNHQPQGKN